MNNLEVLLKKGVFGMARMVLVSHGIVLESQSKGINYRGHGRRVRKLTFTGAGTLQVHPLCRISYKASVTYARGLIEVILHTGRPCVQKYLRLGHCIICACSGSLLSLLPSMPVMSLYSL